MKKTYVIDTNVLIQAPYALHCFEDNDLVIPLVVVEELDGLKKADGEKGANARMAVRMLEVYRGKGNLLTGVSLEDGGIIRIEKNFVHEELPPDLPEEKADNRILKVCQGLSVQLGETSQVVLVTKDLVLRLKAQIIGIRAEDFITEQISESDAQYTGRCEAYIPEELVKDFKKKGVAVSDVYVSDEEGNHTELEAVENEFVILKADQSTKKTLLGRVSGKKILPLEYKKSKPYGVSPRNVGQYFMQEALMTSAQEAPLVIIQGMAGTAKTFYSLVVGMEKVYNNPNGEYRRIMVCRPNTQFDDDIGYLPGSEQEKIAPLMRPIIDNLEQILDSDDKDRYEDESMLSDKIQEVFERSVIQTEALNFIRGRSIAKTYLIIDEAQNMTPNQAKGIITRAGKDTKIILLGDPHQIDKPFLDERTNGLSYAAKCMKGSSYCWQITLSAEECERSVLAMDAIHRL
ncbi:MAG: PhoH family protein [Lachnospiraceae bacterium]|nr:PhoH family protein [Lachnospiraceae bacterium]